MISQKQMCWAFVACCVFIIALIYIPKIQVFGLSQLVYPQIIDPAFYKRDVFTQEDRARQTLATIIGGFLVLVGAYVTWRNMRAAERNAEIAQKNVKIAEDKQLTDRFTAAVTNLSADGPEKMALRLGGIYALERIARDSPDDHWTVIEVLTAYVRDKRPRLQNTNEAQRVVPTDIQAILTVIGRRNSKRDEGNILDLHEVDLFRADLRKANLVNAYLMKADLDQANLWKANLSGAKLWGSKLRVAHLFDANLSNTDLARADLEDADLSEAKLKESKNLTQEQLDSADQEGIPASLPPGLHFPANPQALLSPELHIPAKPAQEPPA